MARGLALKKGLIIIITMIDIALHLIIIFIHTRSSIILIGKEVKRFVNDQYHRHFGCWHNLRWLSRDSRHHHSPVAVRLTPSSRQCEAVLLRDPRSFEILYKPINIIITHPQNCYLHHICPHIHLCKYNHYHQPVIIYIGYLNIIDINYCHPLCRRNSSIVIIIFIIIIIIIIDATRQLPRK